MGGHVAVALPRHVEAGLLQRGRAPAYVRDRTPLKKGEITTAALRNEFRRDPGLPMLIGDEVFVRGVRLGVEQGEYIYRQSDLLLGPGDPFAEIVIDEQSVVFTMDVHEEPGHLAAAGAG